MKTKKTLRKRVKITKSGKLLKKQNRTGHLKRKWTSNKRHRKLNVEEIEAKGYKRKVKTLLGKHGKKVK